MERIISGQVLHVDDSYGLPLSVPPIILYPVLATAYVFELVGLAFTAVFRLGTPASARPKLRSARQGPEFMITPIQVRDAMGEVLDVEVHGHLNKTALVRTDRIRMKAYEQRGRDLPLRAGDIENLTTGRMIRPRRATLWTHFGTPLLLQAIAGAVVVILPVACVFGAFR
jgi:hypothetical protein